MPSPRRRITELRAIQLMQRCLLSNWSAFFLVFSLHISSQEARPLPTAVRNTTSLTEGRPVIGVGRLLAAQEVPRWGYEQEQGEYYQSKHLQPSTQQTDAH